MDFKAQLVSDMKVFHNCGEMATMTDVWYQEKQHYIPIIIDHTAADERQRGSRDKAGGWDRASCLVYMSLYDFGCVPKQGRQIEIDEAGAVNMYRIAKADCEDGEIILELEMLEE
jgi:hypothetical protein